MNAKLLGVNSDTSTCECCGKSNLKRVAVIQLEDGRIVRYGRDCAAKKLNKAMGNSIDLMVEVTAFVNKYAEQYAGRENMITKGLWNKFGVLAKFDNGHYIIQGLGTI